MDEFEALALAAAAKKRRGGAASRNPDGTYGQPPEGMIANPKTGQMTERDLLAANVDASGARSAAAGAMRGLSFGGADEAMGGMYAALGGEGTAGERYAFGREWQRAQEQAAQEENPYLFAGGELGGGITTGLTYGMPAIANRGLAGSMVAGAGVGAAEGAVYGALTGEGGAKDRANEALKHGYMGAALGGAIPIATGAAKWTAGEVKDAAVGAVDAVTGRASQTRANKALANTLAKAGKTPDEIDRILSAAARDGQGEFRAADALGIAGQRRLSSVARSGGDASAEIQDFLESRQINQTERVSGFVSDAFDGNTATAKATRSALEKGRNAAADLDFGAIRASGDPVDVRPIVSLIDSKIQPFKEAGINAPVKVLNRFKKRLIGKGEDGATRELSDFNKVFAIRRELRDTISNLYKNGKSELARDMKDVRTAFDDAMETASGQYRAAMDSYRKSSQVIDAVETGQRMSRPGTRTADVASEFAAMPADQQAAARVGYGDKLLAQVEGQSGGSNRARPLTSAKRKGDAAAIASDPELLSRRVGREMDMFETRNIALGGSRTADNIEDIKELQGYDIGIVANLLRGDVRGAAVQSGQAGVNAATGMNASTRKLIADALLAKDAKAFRSAVKQVTDSRVRKNILDSVLRLGGIQNIDPATMLESIQ